MGEPEFPLLAPALGGGILLVEDHPELAAYLSERLAEFYAVRTVATAEAALPEMHRRDTRILVCTACRQRLKPWGRAWSTNTADSYWCMSDSCMYSP